MVQIATIGIGKIWQLLKMFEFFSGKSAGMQSGPPVPFSNFHPRYALSNKFFVVTWFDSGHNLPRFVTSGFFWRNSNILLISRQVTHSLYKEIDYQQSEVFDALSFQCVSLIHHYKEFFFDPRKLSTLIPDILQIFKNRESIL